MAPCLLCKSTKVSLYSNIKSGTFFNCSNCGVVYRDPKTFLSLTSEKSRYDKHKNNIEDKGFQKSVQPIVFEVMRLFPNTANGLDYGCGNGPVAAELLKKEGYKIELYDPFYQTDTAVLNQKYDFIICNEVMEHFYHPLEEFKKLYKLLAPNGILICGTGVFYSVINFDTWFYKNDPTHVIFYTMPSLDWIKTAIGFKEIAVEKNRITFQK